MRCIVITVLVAVGSVFSAAQHKAKPKGDYDTLRCTPKLIKEASGNSPEFHFREGQEYKHSPVIAYEILESGEIAHPILSRPSGVAEVDQYALKWVPELKFNKRPGCGVVESMVDVTIDFR